MPFFIQNIQIMNWNANGLRSKRATFIDFLSRHSVDVACVSETHLIATEHFRVGGYNIYRKDRTAPVASGGVAIFIKKSISHYEVLLPHLISIEAVSIFLMSKSGEKLKITSVYKPPNKRLNSTDLDKLFFDHGASLLVGDLNCKHTSWNCRVSNPNGNRLFNYVSANNVTVSSPTEPTFYPRQNNLQPDILDIIVNKNFTKPIYHHALPELDSDHVPVLIGFFTQPEMTSKCENLITGPVAWDHFTITLDSSLQDVRPLTSIYEIDAAVLHFTNTVQKSICSSVIKPFPKKSLAFLTPPTRIQNLIKLKHRTRRLWQRNRTPFLKRQLNQLTRQVKVELDNLRISSYNKYLSDIHPGDPNMWQATKRILRKPSVIPPLRVGADVYQSDEEKANALADFYENAFQPNNTDNPEVQALVKDLINNDIATAELPVEFTTLPEVTSIIHNFKTRKAPGYDLITNAILKKLTPKAISFIVSIFNACIYNGYFPKSWKSAEIIVFHKPNKPHDLPSSYRPISLLPTLSKVLEHVIKNRLVSFLEDNNIIPPHQFGFRRKHSATHQLLRISEKIVHGFENKMFTTAMFLDVAQAFDKVWHDGLNYKIRQIGTPKYISNLLQSFLEDRSFVVRINSTRSPSKKITAGVPQGSVLGPVLFSIYLHDIIIPEDTTLALFADDTAILCQNYNVIDARNQLQLSVHRLNSWFYDWKILLNASKCEAKIFSLRTAPDPPFININANQIQWNANDQAVKYLGVYLDRKLNWKFHVNKRLTNAYSRLAQLYPIINRRSHLKTKCTLMFYKALIRPIITYASPVWGLSISKSKRDKIQVLQNKVLRLAVNAPWFVRNTQIHRELGMDTMDICIRNATQKFLLGLQNVDGAQFFRLGEPTNVQRLRPRLPQDLIHI